MGREFAWRVTAAELASALEEEKATGERSASYLLSPLGARMNRILLVGTLGPAEAVGTDPAQPFWRARLADRTGSVTVTAGGFQPRALAALQTFTTPKPALVVAKAHLFHARDGSLQPSARGEELKAVSPETLAELEVEVAEDSLERLELVERLRHEPGLPDAQLAAEEVPLAWVRGARLSIARYPSVELGPFRAALGALVAPPGAPPAEAPKAPVRVHVSRRVESARPAPPPVDHAQEAVFLDLVDELAEGSDDGYADLKEAMRRAGGRGLAEPRVEEILNRLEENGVLEEPIVGKVRRA